METTTLSTGADAERLATRTLLDHGYEIIERNYRGRAGELDIVARQGTTLVFVEVRSRANAEHGSALEMIDHRKQRQVARVAAHYLLENDPLYDEIRFDVVAITGDEVDLIADAFRLGRY